jgi:hypothetical protein
MRGSSYSVLLLKLDEFIRKYYKNQLIRGAIYTVGVVAAFYLFSALVEYFGQLSSVGRAILFYSFVLLTLSILVKFIFHYWHPHCCLMQKHQMQQEPQQH